MSASPEPAVEELRRGRDAYARRAWREAHELLSAADGTASLAPGDLELVATSAYMLGRDEEWMALLERAHHAYLERGEPLRAVRCAFWIGTNLAYHGEIARATGWLARAQRLLEHEDGDSVERGYLLLPLMFRHEAAGDYATAADTARDAAEIGQRFGDADLFALAVHGQGQMLIRDGRVHDGLALLDESMVTATGREMSPIVTGLVYCGVILACQEVYELQRAQEWTAALSRWCDEQPELVAFTGRCLVHRAEIMQAHGAWPEALEEARRAGVRLIETNLRAAGLAFYRQAELHRLGGDFVAAEDAYRAASRYGWDPQPGLALLRLAQGRSDAAAAAIRRATAEATQAVKRDTGQLPFRVDGRAARLAFPVMRFMATRVLTVNTPLGRKARRQIRAHGGPLLRVRSADLAAAGVERVLARTVGVADGLPVLEDGRVVEARNVVWCTGFRNDYAWIRFPLPLDEDGFPEQRRGAVPSWPGLYFVGLLFLHSFSSMLIVGAGRDGERVARQIAAGRRNGRRAENGVVRRDNALAA